MTWLRVMLLIVIMYFIVIMGVCSAHAAETVTTKGTTPEGYVRLKSTTSAGVTKTKGTINGKYVTTRTRNGVTTGTVDGKYIRVKSKEVSKDFKPDWKPDW